MADQKISAMPTATVPLTGAELMPLVQGGSRKDSFCARMSGVVEHAKGDAPRAKASLKRWKCPGW